MCWFAPFSFLRAVRMKSVSLSLSLPKNSTPLTRVALIPEHTYTYLTDAYQDSPRIVGTLDSTRMQLPHQSWPGRREVKIEHNYLLLIKQPLINADTGG